MYTTVSVRSPTPDQNSAPRTSRSPTPGLSFQNLSLRDYQASVEIEQLPTIAEEKTVVVNEVTEPSSPLYTLPNVDDGDTSEVTTSVTSLYGAVLRVSGERSMIDRVENDISPKAGIHRPSPLCAWPTREEAERDWRWKYLPGVERRKESDDGKGHISPSTEVSDAQDPSNDWQPQPVTYSEALEFQRQQTAAKSQKKRAFTGVDFSCIWFCVTMISIPACMHF